MWARFLRIKCQRISRVLQYVESQNCYQVCLYYVIDTWAFLEAELTPATLFMTKIIATQTLLQCNILHEASYNAQNIIESKVFHSTAQLIHNHASTNNIWPITPARLQISSHLSQRCLERVLCIWIITFYNFTIINCGLFSSTFWSTIYFPISKLFCF